MDKGTGLVMACAYGDMQDVTWYKRYAIPRLQSQGKSGHVLFVEDSEGGGEFVAAEKIDCTIHPLTTIGKIIANNGTIDSLYYFHKRPRDILKINSARDFVLEILQEKSTVTATKKIKHTVKCAERSGKPVEVIETHQFYIDFGLLNHRGGRVCYDANQNSHYASRSLIERGGFNLKDAFAKLAKTLHFYPENMRHRLEQWIAGLNQNWCISRNRFAGIRMPYITRYGTMHSINLDVDWGDLGSKSKSCLNMVGMIKCKNKYPATEEDWREVSIGSSDGTVIGFSFLQALYLLTLTC
jgi:valyl-tRNA synthetase